MKTKAIIATGLFTLALLAGCDKAEESTATKAQESAPSATAPAAEAPAATPAPAEAPAPVEASTPVEAPAPAEGK